MQPPTQELIVRDLHDITYTFRHIYRGKNAFKFACFFLLGNLCTSHLS